VKTIHKLPGGLSLEELTTAVHGGNLICSFDFQDNCLNFLRLPPVAGRNSIERWRIPSFHFPFKGFATYPPYNILAAPEVNER